MNKQNNIILPAEWYEQSFIQLTWPHANTDWSYMLNDICSCFTELALTIARYEKVLIVASDTDIIPETIKTNKNITITAIDSNDTWARDHGGITILKDGAAYICDFKFNGWGLKYAADKDNLITSKLINNNIIKANYINCLNFVLEGGSIESDGNGTLLTTCECLLSANRNGGYTQIEINNILESKFGIKKVLWLEHGYLEGDDTDSHIDTLARIAPNNTILYVATDNSNDIHYKELKEMELQLSAFTDCNNTAFSLLPLPLPDPIYNGTERLPATYANFLILNNAVLVPTYNQPLNDTLALQTIERAFPNREIIGINCIPIIQQHGSLHCVTMQYPKNVKLL